MYITNYSFIGEHLGFFLFGAITNINHSYMSFYGPVSFLYVGVELVGHGKGIC